MFHVAGYSTSYTGAGVFTQLATIPDLFLQTRDNALVCAMFNKPGALWGFGATLTRAQFQAPSLRNVAQLEVQPIINAMPGAGASPGGLFVDGHPYQLDDGEELAAWVTHSAALAERNYAFVRLHDHHPVPIDAGLKVFTVRITATTTLTANAWSNMPIAFDQNLPRGKFACVGGRFNSAGMLAWRFVVNGMSNRPGGIAQQSDLAIDQPSQRRGQLGVWFTFDYLSPPTIDALSVSADTSEEGVIDLLYLGNS